MKAIIKLGTRCNNNCLFCHAKRFGNTELEKKQIENKVNILPKKIRMVILSGGEPTIRPDFFDILKDIKKKGLKSGVITNGRMFSNPKFSERSAKLGLKEAYISLHSHRPHIHNKLTEADSFDQTLAGIMNISKKGVKTIVNCVVNKMNYLELKGIVDLLLKTKVSKIRFSSLILNGAAFRNKDKLLVEIEDAARYAQQACEYSLSKGKKCGLEGFPLCYIDFRKDLLDDLSTNKITLMSDPQENEFFITDNGPRAKTKTCRECEHEPLCPGVCEEYVKIHGFFPAFLPEKRTIKEIERKLDKTDSHYKYALYYIQKNIPKEHRILELDAREGNFINTLKSQGFRNVIGIDKKGSNPNIINIDLYDLDGEFDMIIAMNPIEKDLMKVMSKIHELLSFNGELLIQTNSRIGLSILQNIGFENLETLENKKDKYAYVFRKVGLSS